MAVHDDTPQGEPELVPSHWRWRPDWTPQRTALWWYITFREHPLVAETGRGLAEALTRETALDVNPARWLHLTLREFGFVDDVSTHMVDDGVAATRLALQDLSPFMLRIAGIGVLPGAVVRWVEPRPAVEGLRAALAGCDPPALAHADEVAPEVWRPHVSVAYARDDFHPIGFSHLPQPVEVQLPVTRVTLAAVSRRNQHYEWQIRERIPIGSGRPDWPG